VVSAVGEKVSHLKVGDRVMALTGWGSFAEQVAVPGYNVLPIPPSMDFNTAAAFSMTYGTSMHALKQRATCNRVKPCWYSAPPAVSVWPPWKSAKPWAPGSSPPPAAPKNSPWPRPPAPMN
jgi:NADPH:quinone reductase-like Zn-dependent oxidoreductase